MRTYINVKLKQTKPSPFLKSHLLSLFLKTRKSKKHGILFALKLVEFHAQLLETCPRKSVNTSVKQLCYHRTITRISSGTSSCTIPFSSYFFPAFCRSLCGYAPTSSTPPPPTGFARPQSVLTFFIRETLFQRQT